MRYSQSSTPSGPSTSRYGYLLVGILLLLAMGLVYAWSIFIPPLRKEFNWSPSQTSMGFTILMSMFCLGGMATGFITKKLPAKYVICFSALLIGGGFYGVSTINSLAGLYLFFSVMVGLGVGMSYNAVLSTVLRWFPDKLGIISGLLMMGFGLGSFILSTVGTSMIGNLGWRMAFVRLGIGYFFLILISSFFIRPPSPSVVFPKSTKAKNILESGLELSTGAMIKRLTFWIFFSWSVVLTAAGLMVIGSAATIAGSLGAEATKAGFMTGLIAISNGCGRVIAGFLFDKVGRQVVLPLISLLFMVTGLILYVALTSDNLTILVIGFIFTGLSYGGLPPSSSTVISLFYGLKNYSLNFSLINTNIVVASFLGPALAGVMQARYGTFQTTFVTIIIFGGLSFGLSYLIKKP
ncbi:MAG: MFS transporter [Deltaproteobacteria bacterium]|nr:MFS transporter [Deltaproteobacteria bacterium]